MSVWAVVGGTGFVGSAIVAHVKSLEHDVVTVSAPRLRATGDRLDILIADLRNSGPAVEQLARLLEGCEVVINAAGMPDADSGPSADLTGANALLPTVIGRAAQRAGANRYIHVSSATVQGHSRVLSESEIVSPFSAYSISKALGEQLLLQDDLQPPSTAVVRAVSVMARSRRTTQRLIRLSRSRLASVARSSDGPAPISLIENTAAAIAFVGSCSCHNLARVILLPGDGLSVREALQALGSRRVLTIPNSAARMIVSAVGFAGRWIPRMTAEARRAEMLWFGQACEADWLASHGFVAPVGREGWRRLAESVDDTPRPRLLAMVTIAPSVRHFLSGQLDYLQSQGFDVSVLSSPGADLDEIASQDGVKAIPFPMAREISPVRDVRDLLRMLRVLRSLRPDIVNYGTPKASLLGGLAAWLMRIPVRVYTLHGLRLETTNGLRHAVLYMAEWITCRTAHVIVCVSPSLRDEAVRQGLAPAHSAMVLGPGTCNGVDIERFARSASTPSRVRNILESLEWSDRAPVVGFVGRLTRDKGIPELVQAFRSVRERVPGVHLLLVGDFEDGDPVPTSVRREIDDSVDIAVTGMLSDPSGHFHLMDVLALPTRREGFGGVILEAAAASVPSVTTTATGARDAVVDGVTGLLIPVGDPLALADALVSVLEDPSLRDQLAKAANNCVVEEFERYKVWARIAALYRELLPRPSGSHRCAIANPTEESDQL